MITYMKQLIGIVAVLLTFVGYIPYIKDTVSGKTTPHIFTWFIWGLVTALAFGLQLTDNAGPGSFVTLAAAIVCFAIFGFGLRNGNKNIAPIDAVFLGMALLSVVIWLFAKEPVISVILLSTIDMLGFLPTVRKSWKKPYEETLFSYEMNTFRFGLAIFALDKYSLITALYPVTWIVANGLFSLFLIVRRFQIKSR
jgi:uncharacterized protein with PQ loop repeat